MEEIEHFNKRKFRMIAMIRIEPDFKSILRCKFRFI